MKKTVAILALSASSSAFALRRPPVESKTICLDVYENNSGVNYAGACDQARNNETSGVTLLENGCAEGQISLIAKKYAANQPFDINIASCLPPNVVQL